MNKELFSLKCMFLLEVNACENCGRDMLWFFVVVVVGFFLCLGYTQEYSGYTHDSVPSDHP